MFRNLESVINSDQVQYFLHSHGGQVVLLL